MVAQLQPEPQDLTRAEVIERVQQYIDHGKTPNEAFVEVWEEIERAGDIEVLARLHGSALVGMLWRAWNIDHRPAGQAQRLIRPIRPGGLLAAEGRPNPPGRVVDLTPLRETSTMDSLYKIDGSWVRLGDMDRKACLKVFQQYRSAAISDEHKARHIRAIAERLGEGDTVQQKFTESELMRLFKICKPPGNTLA